jgi:hypothetical protein
MHRVRDEAINAVMDLQEEQWNAAKDDGHQLSLASRKITKESVVLAIHEAVQDTLAAKAHLGDLIALGAVSTWATTITGSNTTTRSILKQKQSNMPNSSYLLGEPYGNKRNQSSGIIFQLLSGFTGSSSELSFEDRPPIQSGRRLPPGRTKSMPIAPQKGNDNTLNNSSSLLFPMQQLLAKTLVLGRDRSAIVTTEPATRSEPTSGEPSTRDGDDPLTSQPETAPSNKISSLPTPQRNVDRPKKHLPLRSRSDTFSFTPTSSVTSTNSVAKETPLPSLGPRKTGDTPPNRTQRRQSPSLPPSNNSSPDNTGRRKHCGTTDQGRSPPTASSPAASRKKADLPKNHPPQRPSSFTSSNSTPRIGIPPPPQRQGSPSMSGLNKGIKTRSENITGNPESPQTTEILKKQPSASANRADRTQNEPYRRGVDPRKHQPMRTKSCSVAPMIQTAPPQGGPDLKKRHPPMRSKSDAATIMQPVSALPLRGLYPQGHPPLRSEVEGQPTIPRRGLHPKKHLPVRTKSFPEPLHTSA